MRDLDVTAVREIAWILRHLAKSELSIVILDVGSGTGRYLESVLAESGLETTRRCCAVRYDAVREMLGGTSLFKGLHSHSIKSVVGVAEHLPFADDSVDAILAFNAIHHFGVTGFLGEVARVLLPGGKVIIYTRTPEQNRCTVWGMFFPRFADKEDRLFTERQLAAVVDQIGAFGKVKSRVIPWRVETDLRRLIEQARSGAYSTFEFYSKSEFENLLEIFERQVLDHFDDPSRVVVQNDHLLAVATKRSRS
jgi:SAM-dependent methyltransferase